MNPPVQLRKAVAADSAAIARIHVAAWRAAYRGLMPDGVLENLSVDRSAILWERRLWQANGAIFVVERDGEIIGFCDLIPSRDRDAERGVVAEIGAIYIMPGHWRNGAGRMLTHRAIDEARKLGYRVLTLWALTSNLAARKFYEAIGFATDGAEKTEPAGDGSDFHEIRYRISL